MEKVQKKDFLIVGICFLALTLLFLVLYFRDEISEPVLESEKQVENQEEIFKYTPVVQVSLGNLCPEIFVDERDGNQYSVVQIGKQCWMAENLNYEAEGASCFEERDIYGCYYEWELAKASCPTGWKLASDNDWKTLEIQLGMDAEEAHKVDGYRYTFVENGEVGGMLKSQNLWNEPNECFGECNASGFTVLPAGSRGEDSASDIGEKTFFWTSSESEGTEFEGAVMRKLEYGGPGISRERTGQTNGYSVRCLME